MILNYMPTLPLPVLLMSLPLAGTLLFLALEGIKFIYARLNRQMLFEFGRLSLRIIFFVIIIMEMVLSLCLWYRFQDVQQASYVPGAAGWTTTLMGVSGSAVHSYIQADVFSATAAALTSFSALIACFSALADKVNPLTRRKALFYLLTLGGVQGIFFSSGLFNLFACMLVSQIGASGLVRPVLRERQEFARTVCYFISRFLILAMFFSGSVMIAIKYGAFNFVAASQLMQTGYAEKCAFALLATPLLYLFLKPPIYTTDAASRCYFAIRANAAFFVFFRIIFVLHGAIEGFARIPALIGVIGIVTVFTSMVFSAKERDPIRFVTAIESSLKGCILIALAMSVSGVYSAAAIVDYGYGALEALMQLLFIFLPVSAALSITAVQLRQKADGRKLWLSGGHFSQLAYTGLLFSIAVCMLVGLPPLGGFAARQFLYRSANTINPFLMLFLFASSIFILFTGLRFIALIMFGKKDSEDVVFMGDSTICLPLVLLSLSFILISAAPGILYERITSSTVSLIVSKVQYEAGGTAVKPDTFGNQPGEPAAGGELEVFEPESVSGAADKHGNTTPSGKTEDMATSAGSTARPGQPEGTVTSADSVAPPARQPESAASQDTVTAPKTLYSRIVGFLFGNTQASDENDEDDDMLELPDDEFGNE